MFDIDNIQTILHENYTIKLIPADRREFYFWSISVIENKHMSQVY